MSDILKVKYLIVGGGTAACQGAVGIRERDKDGSVLMVCREHWWPYDHPPLSKDMLVKDMDPTDTESKDPKWYAENNVEVRHPVEALSLDCAARQVTLSDGTTVEYKKLLIATGADPKPLEVKGKDLQNIHLFRHIEDSLSVRDALKHSKNVVLVGAGYIGLEVASGAIANGAKPTLIDPTDRPWSRNTSPQTGQFLKEYFESKGATFHFGEEVTAFEGENRVEAVITNSGKRIEADLVIVGTGVQLNTKFAQSGGLAVDEKNGILVNEHLQASDPDVYVAGDVADFQDKLVGKRWHAEHHLNATWQGKTAGLNMAGASETYERVPYFFSDMLDIHMVLRGDPQGGKSASVLGDMKDADFIELYAREDGTLAMGLAFTKDESKLDPISDKLEQLFLERAEVAKIQLNTFTL